MDAYTPFRNVEAKNFVQERFEVPRLLAALGVPRGGRILEVGCGRGVALVPLGERCRPKRLVGIDVDAALLNLAAKRLARFGVEAELVQADVRALPFADASFEVVVDFGTIYHVDRAERALSEIARVLVPDGLLVHETRVAQLTAHPIRSLGHRVPWGAVPELATTRTAGFWASRVKTAA